MACMLRTFEAPDQVHEVGGVRSAVLEIGEMVVARTVMPVGWRWSTHVRPHVGTDLCRTRHVGLVLSGRLEVQLEDGSRCAFGPGDVIDIPPGHDGATLGDEPCVLVEWSGAREWLRTHDADRVLATLLFTDIVDSTPLARRLGDRAWRSLLASHDEAIRTCIGEARGRVVKHTGDGFLALFEGPARALGAAARIRDAVRTLGIEVREAVHVAEVEIRRGGGDIAGLAVHEAARILSAAGPSEILVSEIAHTLSATSAVEFEPRGSVSLKGLEGPRTLFALR